MLIRGVWHSYATLKERLDLDIGKELLGAGTHQCARTFDVRSLADVAVSFAFEIVIPADTAPYESCEQYVQGCRDADAADISGQRENDPHDPCHSFA